MVFLWIFLYGLVYSVCSALARATWMLPAGMLAYTAGFLVWICRGGYRQQIWIWKPGKVSWGTVLQMLPLLMPAAGNWLANNAAFPEWETALVLICVSVTEELFFRGFLFRHLLKRGVPQAVLGSALVFSLMHLGNLLSGADLGYTLIQLGFSFWAGVCYCLVILRWKNIWPCIGAHVLTNLAAAVPAGRDWLPASVGYCVIYGIYSLWLYHNLRNQKKEIVP